MQKILLRVLIICLTFFSLLNTNAEAAVVYDLTTGNYTDNFADALGIVTNSGARVNTTTGKVQLLKEGSTTLFTTPYRLTGSVTTKTIGDYLGFSAVKWGTISAQTTIPDGTSIKVQVLDSASGLFPDSILAGNSTGFDLSSPVDISALPMTKHNGSGKMGKIRLKFILTTNSTTVTPLIDSINFTWTTKQGDLSATTASGVPWGFCTAPKPDGRQYSEYSNSNDYKVPRWIKEYERDFIILTRAIYKDLAVYQTWSDNPKLIAINKRTGEIVWEIPMADTISQYVVGENGTLYAYTMTADMAMAIDLNDGKLKWTFQSQNFPHGSGIALGQDGTIYYILVKTSAPYDMTLFALNPDGTEKFRQMIDNTVSNPSQIIQGADGTLYVLANAKLFALDPSNGSTKWVYQTGPLASFANFFVDDGTIYLADNDLNGDINVPKKIYAINADGTEKWVYVSEPGTNGFNRLIVKGDILFAKNVMAEELFNDMQNTNSPITKINKETGEYIETLSSISYANPILIDNKDNLYYTRGEYTDSENQNFRLSLGYMDFSNYNTKWEFSKYYKKTDDAGRIVMINVPGHMIDEDGWAYFAISKITLPQVPDEQWLKYVAMAPWTIAGSSNDSTYSVGDTVNFSVTTSMLKTDPLERTDNQVQVYLDNSVRIPLTYSSTNESGDTVWTGSYTLPSNTTAGVHTYSVEASSTNIVTDITTHFDSAVAGTNNTGIVNTGGFTVTDFSFANVAAVSSPKNLVTTKSATSTISASNPSKSPIDEILGDDIGKIIEPRNSSGFTADSQEESELSNDTQWPVARAILAGASVLVGVILFRRPIWSLLSRLFARKISR